MNRRNRIAVFHGYVPPEARADEQDVLVEVEAVSAALRSLGYEPPAVPLTLDLQQAASQLMALAPLAVFNLVESIEGSDRLLHLGPALLDSLGLPYTGSRTESMMLSSNKLLAKRILRQAGIPTPAWNAAEEALEAGPSFDPPYIVKSVWDNASLGLERLLANREELVREIRRRSEPRLNAGQAAAAPLAAELFVESYIEGRELNLSMVETAEGPRVLPPAEMLFVDYPADKPRIVGYAAKWDPSSFEYQHTVRRFEFPVEEEPLLAELLRLSRECWRELGMGGYARVDFRVDERGRPWVLEVNPNPCLSPDAGLPAAAERAGLAYEELVETILAPALRRRTRSKADWRDSEPPAEVAEGASR